MIDTVQLLPEWESIKDRICFIIAGDIVYEMAHAVPRPEISTGIMVRGSDLDIIAIAEDDVPPEALQALDAAILRRKHLLLVQPNYQEEIDYLVKNIAKVRAQLMFDSFQHMIAGKIMIGVEFGVFINSLTAGLLNFGDVAHGLIKSVTFGLMMATASCYFGVAVKGGAPGVGRAVNSASISVGALLRQISILTVVPGANAAIF